MIKQKPIWGRYELKNGMALEFTGGQASVIIKRLTNGWMVSKTEQADISDKLLFEANDSFSHKGDEAIFQTGRSDILHVLPALPVKPVVLRNYETIKISPKQTITLYLSIPVNVQFYYSQIDQHHLMTESELQKLSDTWFGETDTGEPAFSLGQRFSLRPENLQVRKHEALCPVKINNISNLLLELERLIIRVENLSVYLKNDQLITSKVSIDYKGSDQISNLHFSTDKTLHGEHPTLIAKPRNTVSTTILGKSFHFIKHLTQ